MDKALNAIIVCRCSLILFFVLPCFLHNGRSDQSNAAFFYSTEAFALEAIVLFIHNFFEKYFGVFDLFSCG